MQTKKKTLKQAHVEFAKELRRLAELAMQRYIENGCCVRLHLYGRKDAGIWQEFDIAAERSRPWLPVIPEAIPWEKPLDVVADWIEARLRREPLWIFAEC